MAWRTVGGADPRCGRRWLVDAAPHRGPTAAKDDKRTLRPLGEPGTREDLKTAGSLPCSRPSRSQPKLKLGWAPRPRPYYPYEGLWVVAGSACVLDLLVEVGTCNG